MVVDESPAHPGVAGQRGDREWFTGFEGGVQSGDHPAGLVRGVEPAEGDEPVGVLGRGVLSHGQLGRLWPLRWWGRTLAGGGGSRPLVRSYVPCEGRTPC